MDQSTRKATVVLLDDEPFMLTAMSNLLSGAGYTVHSCNEWSTVAAVVREAQPDLVLLDYNMPTLKGDKICEILKRNMTGKKMSIFIFSSEPESDLIRIVSQCGADGYVRKNLPPSDLLSRIGAIVDAIPLSC